VQENGVTYPLNHDNYEKELLKQSTDGVDIIIDNMAGSTFSKNQCLLKPLGRIVLIGREMDRNGQYSLMRHNKEEMNPKGFFFLVGHREEDQVHVGYAH
jgi:NADPH:quinone reductase-like Zn-dependent oxidoreductase